MPGGVFSAVLAVMAVIFVLGFFLDTFEIIFIVVPITAPALIKLGVDPIWLGVMIGVNLQASFLTPPFGFALFYLRSVAPHEDYDDRLTRKKIAKVTTGQIYWGAVPFVVIQVVMVGLVIAFPGMVTSSIDKPVSKEAIESIQLETEPGGYGEQEGEKAQEGEEGADADADGKPSGEAREDDLAAELQREMAAEKKKGK